MNEGYIEAQKVQNKEIMYKELRKIMTGYLIKRVFGLTCEDIEDYAHDFATEIILTNKHFEHGYQLSGYIYKWSSSIIHHPTGNRKIHRFLKKYCPYQEEDNSLTINKVTNQHGSKAYNIKI